jgi:nucleoside-diphosphate-sugar epimerase
MRVLVAGAGGAIGSRLVPQLVERGHEVVATTRNPEKLARTAALGAETVVMNGLDAGSVGEVVARAKPDAIVHQMTALAGATDLKHFDDAFAVTNELRTRGTEHLLAAAEAVGVRRFVAQGYTGWPYARDGGRLKTEDDPFDPRPPAAMRRTLDALRRQEELVAAAPLDGVVLRYGSFYGPGASDELVELVRRRKLPLVGDGAGIWSWIHVDDAAAATVAAVEGGETTGALNVCDDEPAPVSEWLPYLAEVLGAKPPRHVPAALARLLAGASVVSLMTQIRGASNANAKRELGWQPSWSSWRVGFREGLDDAPSDRAAA